MLETIELPGSTRWTTRVGFGCSGLMGGISERESLRLLETAFDAGIRHFDVAPSYGHGMAERCLGKFLKNKTAEVTVTTKYGILPPRQAGLLGIARNAARPIARRIPAVRKRVAAAAASLKAKARFGAEDARLSLENSLRELGVERVDLWLMHEATADDLDSSDLLAMLERMRDQGRIGMYGMGTERGCLDALRQRHPEYCRVLQFEWSVRHRKPDFPGAFLIHHRAISSALRAIQESFQRDSGLCRRWSDALDADLAKPDTIAALLLNGALESNPNGLVLFSSRVPGHIRANTLAAGDPMWAARSRLLMKLVDRHFTGLR